MAGTDPAMAIAVCDAGPIIHLDELNSLDLLADFSDLLLPTAVAEEVQKHRPTAVSRLSARRVAPVQSFSPEFEAIARAVGLHSGEKEALRIAQSHVGAILLSDDTAARLAARQLRITAHGTIGLVIRAIRRGKRTKSQALTILRSIPVQSTLHIRATLLLEFIRDVEQSQ